MNTPRWIGSPWCLAERNTRMPDTGSLRDRITTSTFGSPALKASSLLTSENATPGRAGTSSRSSCSRM